MPLVAVYVTALFEGCFAVPERQTGAQIFVVLESLLDALVCDLEGVGQGCIGQQDGGGMPQVEYLLC